MILGLLTAVLVAAAAQVYNGVPATAAHGGTVRGVLTAQPQADDPRNLTLDFAQYRDGREQPIRDYDVDMTQRMHVIVVSDDFGTFLHVHPVEAADGHFRGPLALPHAGRYYIYADSQPHGLDHTVLRFTVDAGNAPAPAAAAPPPKSATAVTGPYRVTLDTLSLPAGKTAMLMVHITRGEKPAADLHPYLGGSAHAVFINTASLAYIHVHPMSMDGMEMSDTAMSDMGTLPDSAHVDPAMMLHVAVPGPGTYRLWLQFRGGSALYVAPFELTAR